MTDIPLSVLFLALFVLIILSGFFSGSETGLMTLNRYRLSRLAKDRKRGAVQAQRLLDAPEKLIGLILLGNNFVNVLAALVAGEIGRQLGGNAAVAIAGGLLTLVLLIFAEVTPKTLAALHPERLAFPAALILLPLLRLLWPVVWLVNLITRGLFRLMGISAQQQTDHSLSSEELRIVVNEAGAMIPRRHQKMLLSILDLERATVEDIMVPRNEIAAIDIDAEWAQIREQITASTHTRLLVYEGDIDHVVGFIHLRNTIKLFHNDTEQELGKEDLRGIIREAYFIPEGTPLTTTLLNFQRERRRIGLVVDEYGDIQGLVTLEDILEEIVGEFTTDPAATIKDIHRQEDGSYLVDGSITIRDLNRALGWQLASEGPRTLNGRILEYLEDIPDPGTSLMLENHPVEIVHTTKNAVKTVRIAADKEQTSADS
ncbi:MAG TPA: HlyC/CorC family transporter [Gammaproteobacteria bacterium]|nr:HlyC/CorC family transporter [Gammaproteobacteria bacterium]